MTLTGKIEPADYRRATWIHMRPRPLFAAAGVVIVVLALGVFVFALYQLLITGDDLILVLIMGGSLAYLAVSFFVWLPRRLRRLYEQQKALHAEFTFEITDDHLACTSAYGNAHFAWGMFHKWKSARDFVIVYHSDVLFNMFPRRWFPSAADFEAFQDILRKHLGPEKPLGRDF